MPPVPPITRTLIESVIKEHRVVVFSKTWCPFCAKLKDVLRAKFIDYHKVELDKVVIYSVYNNLPYAAEIKSFTKVEIFVKNRNFRQKSKFSSNIEIFVQNRNFR